MEQFPPAGFIPTESQLDGITVYMPAPVQADHQEVVAFRCPQCDGETAYNAADGGLTCGYCAYHEAPEQAVVGRNAETFEFTVATLNQASQGWGTERKEVECQGCGSHIVVEPNTLTTSCPFCQSNKVVQHKAPQDVLRPRFLIPFKIDDDECHKMVRHWLGDSWLVPEALKELASIGDFTPMYLPFWTFDAHAKAKWQAQVGHTQTYTENGETKTRIVWKWESGRVDKQYENVQVRGSERLSSALMKQVQEFDLSELTAYDAQFLAGTQSLAYEQGLEESWGVARRAMRDRTRTMCENQTSTSRVRNFTMALEFEDDAWRYMLLPIYIANYHYNNQPFQLLVNGQTGIVAGQRPADWVKLAVTALVPMLLGTLIMLWQWLVQVSDSQLPMIVAGLLFLLGLILAITLGLQGAKLSDA